MIVFVAHKGLRFDFHLPLHQMKRNNLLNLLQDPQFGYGLDTLLLAKISACISCTSCSAADVKATCLVLRHQPFWNQCMGHFMYFVGMADEVFTSHTVDALDNLYNDSKTNYDDNNCHDIDNNSK